MTLWSKRKKLASRSTALRRMDMRRPFNKMGCVGGMVGDESPSVGSGLSLSLGQPSYRRGRDQRPRSDLEGIDLSGLDELVDRAATHAERLRCAVNRVCEFIHCSLRWSAAMRRATRSEEHTSELQSL